MGLLKNKGLNSIENVRTKIFYISAIFTIVGEFTDIFTSDHPKQIVIAGYFIIGIAITIVILRYFKILNNTWSNFIIVYFLLLDVISTLYVLINKEEFYSYLIRVNVLLFVVIPYAGFNINKFHSIIVGVIFMSNYIIISFLSDDELLIKGIPVISIIVFAFVIGIYLLIHNLILVYDTKEELLKKSEKANTTLKKRKKELKEAIESKNALFSIISHDLRNPFNIIIGFNDLIDLALQKNDIEKIRKYHPLIKTSTDRAYSLINNLLTWAKSQKEDINFEPSKFLYNRLVNNAIALISNDSKRKNITIKSEIPETHTMVADKNMISAVVRNLITNAIKFTPINGSVSIGVISRDGKFMYYVKDTGIGATKEKLEKMFSGQQIESEPGTMNEKGSGLGLNICKGFIEKHHHGKIWAEINEHKGLTVFFTIGV